MSTAKARRLPSEIVSKFKQKLEALCFAGDSLALAQAKALMWLYTTDSWYAHRPNNKWE